MVDINQLITGIKNIKDVNRKKKSLNFSMVKYNFYC